MQLLVIKEYHVNTCFEVYISSSGHPLLYFSC